MEKVKVPDIDLTSDSEDYIDDYWFTSPSASFDGSSVNSIPWADDVVKQNQELWERVERMFYGEESLPTNDIKLRNEIIEWTKHFPYLRVSGDQMPIHCSNHVTPSSSHFEEILAIHPPLYNDRKPTTMMTPTTRTIDEKTHRFHDDPVTNGTLADDIEKCLRITSGPLLSRRAQNSRTAYGTRSTVATNNPHSNFVQTSQNRNKHGLKSALVSVRSNYDIGAQFARKLYGSIDVERLHSVPYSARIIKIPSLRSDTGDLSTIATHKPNMIRIKTAALVPISRPLRNSITLPAINIEPKYFERCTNNEAISALVYQNTSTKVLHSPQKSTKKRSESE